MHLQKLLGPLVWRTTVGCVPAVAPALGVAQQSELSHAQTAYRHPSSPSGSLALGMPWKHEHVIFFGGNFFLSHYQERKEV